MPSVSATPSLWSSLEELEDDPALLDALHREFPAGATALAGFEDPISRRRFLKLLGASAGLAGLTACTKMPPEKIIPYVVQPEEFVPGRSLHYATHSLFDGYAKGLIAASREGRPIKLEGNPLHPASLGGSDLFQQAELLELYDPERAQCVRHLGQPTTWDAFSAALRAERGRWAASQGEGVRLVTGPVTSPTLLSQLGEFLARHPKAAWIRHEPVGENRTRAATRGAFGRELRPWLELSRARLVVSFEDDFLGPGPNRERYARDFMSVRHALRDSGPAGVKLNPLFMIESSVSLTGSCADSRHRARPSELVGLVRALGGLVGVAGLESAGAPEWLRVLAARLKAEGAEALVTAGSHLPAELQEIVFATNARLGSLGTTLKLLPSELEGARVGTVALERLADELRAGQVSALVSLGANPVYDAPGSLELKRHLERAAFRVSLGRFADETAAACDWQLPESHFLETWGDARAYDGTASLQQPLITPLYETRSAIEVLAMLNGHDGLGARQAVRETWRDRLSDADFEVALRDGVIRGTSAAPARVGLRPGWRPAPPRASGVTAAAGALEAVFRPDPTIWDGRYANNAWLQELPKPVLQLTWENALLLSPATARELQLEDGDELELTAGGRALRGPVLRAPGHADGVVTLFLGYGRARGGSVGEARGYDAYAFRDPREPHQLASVGARKLGTRSELALVHSHHRMEGRDLVVRGLPKVELVKEPATLLSDWPSGPQAWAMVIDLSVCIGCQSCVIACQAENNIPIVGKEQVRASREMHWIRVDRYFDGAPENPRVYFQPVPCMHCEKAPCELVCPTVATNHSSDGLNQMIYNRCVGTRYCSNNCPYKVRRFNFFEYARAEGSPTRAVANPDVTVRSRGVMEKCTYCVQRIQNGRIEAEIERRPLRDGEIRTACQQACPTDAIVFGDKNDPASRVARLRALPQHYKLLNELGAKPRTTYLSVIRAEGGSA